MKYSIQHIALMLLAVFTVTIVPFNALHRHAEDDHAAFMHSHKMDAQHHCELDNHFCQSDLDADCGHESHLQNKIEQCFTCEFHFIENFVANTSLSVLIQETASDISYTFIVGNLSQAIVLQSNKGPPRLV